MSMNMSAGGRDIFTASITEYSSNLATISTPPSSPSSPRSGSGTASDIDGSYSFRAEIKDNAYPLSSSPLTTKDALALSSSGFDPFSTVYDWFEVDPDNELLDSTDTTYPTACDLVDPRRGSTDSYPDCIHSSDSRSILKRDFDSECTDKPSEISDDVDNCEIMFLEEGTVFSGFFDPLQTITDDGEADKDNEPDGGERNNRDGSGKNWSDEEQQYDAVMTDERKLGTTVMDRCSGMKVGVNLNDDAEENDENRYYSDEIIKNATSGTTGIDDDDDDDDKVNLDQFEGFVMVDQSESFENYNVPLPPPSSSSSPPPSQSNSLQTDRLVSFPTTTEHPDSGPESFCLVSPVWDDNKINKKISVSKKSINLPKISNPYLGYSSSEDENEPMMTSSDQEEEEEDSLSMKSSTYSCSSPKAAFSHSSSSPSPSNVNFSSDSDDSGDRSSRSSWSSTEKFGCDISGSLVFGDLFARCDKFGTGEWVPVSVSIRISSKPETDLLKNKISNTCCENTRSNCRCDVKNQSSNQRCSDAKKPINIVNGGVVTSPCDSEHPILTVIVQRNDKTITANHETFKLELELLPGLNLSEKIICTSCSSPSENQSHIIEKRLFGLALSKMRHFEKVYLKNSSSVKVISATSESPSTTTSSATGGKFGSFVSGFTSGLKKLESLIPRLTFETSNVLISEVLVEFSSYDFDSIYKIKNSLEDVLFNFSRSAKNNLSKTTGSPLGVSNPKTRGDQNLVKTINIRVSNGKGLTTKSEPPSLTATPKSVPVDKRSFQHVRFLRSLSQRFSQHLLSKDEAFDENVENGKFFRREELILELIDECSLDISCCLTERVTNLKLKTKVFCTMFLNKPFQAILAVNDKRRVNSQIAKTILTSKNGFDINSKTSSPYLVAIEKAKNCSLSLSDYLTKRELTFDDNCDLAIGQRIEAMRLKVFSETELNAKTLPLCVIARLNLRCSGKLQLKIGLSARRPCRDILLRFKVPEGWLRLFQFEASLQEARNAKRSVAAIGLSKLQALINADSSADPSAFEVSCGEAWFSESASEIVWKIFQLSETTDIIQPEYLRLKLNLIGRCNSGPRSDWLNTPAIPPDDLIPTNRFVKIRFIVEDYNVSDVRIASVQIDHRRSEENKNQTSASDVFPEENITVFHHVKFEYCVEMEVKNDADSNLQLSSQNLN